MRAAMWILVAVFVGMKLCGVVAWPWLWVFSPMWIPLGIMVGGACLLVAGPVVWIVLFGGEA